MGFDLILRLNLSSNLSSLSSSSEDTAAAAQARDTSAVVELEAFQ